MNIQGNGYDELFSENRPKTPNAIESYMTELGYDLVDWRDKPVGKIEKMIRVFEK